MHTTDNAQPIELEGTIGWSGSREVFLGFAPAALLYRVSFADVLDEATGQGYQRRFSRAHSLEFRHYISTPSSTTIPLTFNLRPESSHSWQLSRKGTSAAILTLKRTEKHILAQVDCQHRLGHLQDLDVSLPFMTFIGLSVRDETEVFNIINGKAKGLSSSLTDFHEARLSNGLATVRPEIFIALQLQQNPDSPWHQRLDLGGENTVGLQRYASLRTMQKAAKRFLRESNFMGEVRAEDAVPVLVAFWRAVAKLMPTVWQNPRKHLLMKGIGVYSLMSLAGDIFREAQSRSVSCDEDYFIAVLSDFLPYVDWTSHGRMRGYGGSSGADQALAYIRDVRRQNTLKAIPNG